MRPLEGGGKTLNGESTAADPLPQARLQGRRILLIAYTYPPMPTVGANRTDAMARHLRLLGHDVTVLTTAAFGRRRDLRDERGVVRVPDLTSSVWLRRLLRRPALLPQEDSPAGSRPDNPEVTPLPGLLARFFVPDPMLPAWALAALVVAIRLVRRRRIECVITSSPYESVHLLGLALRRLGPAWVADFRDGWQFNDWRPPFPAAAQRRLDGALERAVMCSADRVVAATPAIADDARVRFGVDATCIRNGVDAWRHRELPAPRLPVLPSDAVTLAHVGSLLSGGPKDPRPLLEGFRRLRASDPDLASRLHLLFVGRLEAVDREALADSLLGNQVLLLGERSHAESLAIQRKVDGLALILDPGSPALTGKLSEYLHAGRPIIAIADADVAAVVRETGTGVSADPRDPDAIAIQLRRLVTGELAASYKPEGLEAYAYPMPAQLMAAEVERAIAEKRSARTR
jgi:glycosyltransferase involved in cell wall biosynthesis